VNSDLAYGTGFLKKPKRKGVRSRKGKEIDRDAYRGYGESSTRIYGRESSTITRDDTREREHPRYERRGTDAEILAVGAGLAKLARDQNKRDLKDAKSNARGSGAFVVEPSIYREGGASRGLGPSKVSHQSSAVDDDGWESASDAESESSVDSKLAFGEESTGGWLPWGGKERHKSQTRKSSVVDPRLFGRQNSLNGLLNEPVGFGEATWSSSSDFGQQRAQPGTFAGPAQVPYYGQQTPSQAPPTQVIVNNTQAGYYPQPISGPIPPPESVASSSRAPLQHVYPMPTDDPSRFDVARSSVVSGAEPYISSRPRPLPLQQPQPITPVSQSVYEPVYSTRSESSVMRRAPSPSGRGKSLAEAALMGVAGAAVGAAIVSDRNDGRKDKRRDDRDTSSRVSERKDDKDDRRREKRREKDKSKDSDDDKRRDKKRDKRRDEDRDGGKDRERRREERRNERTDERYDSRRARSDISTVSTTTVDPFQYQVADDAFATPIIPSTPNQGRISSVPAVVTVEREPDFSRIEASNISDRHVVTKSEPLKDDRDVRERHHKRKDSRERTFHNAEEIYHETERSTAPIEAAAMGAAIAAVTAEDRRESRSERRRDERRGSRRDYDEYDETTRDRDLPRESKHERDPIQEEADRAYREIIMARKIASQVIRSRSPSPDPSVVHKYDDDSQEKEVIRIVTPPGMEDHKKKGPYDAPNADFQLDYVLENPQDLRTFNIPIISREAPYLKRDPDTSLPRPHLNLVRPTPAPSPMPEKQVARTEKKRSRSNSTKSNDRQDQEKSVSSKDVVIDSQGTVMSRSSTSSTPTSSTTPKGVTWGENETKHFTVESPSEHRDEFVTSSEVRAQDKSVEKPKGLPKVGKRSGGWGAIVAGVTGASFATGAGSETSNSPKVKDSDKSRDKDRNDSKYEYRGIVVEPESYTSSADQRGPPSPGPKPSSPRSSQIPGSFDDLDFAATVAAGLQDTGFDPNIVIDDPSFRRRESPPGSNIYRAPFAETVSDLGAIPTNPTSNDAQGFAVRNVPDNQKELQSTSFDNDDTFAPAKLSKKEQKKREKAARMDSTDVFSTPLEEAAPYHVEEPESYFETPKLSKKEQKKRDKAAQRSNSQTDTVTPLAEPSVAQDIVEEPESYFETPKKSKKKSKKGSSTFDYEVADSTSREDGKVSVPVDAFDDLQNGEDEWNDTKKSKKKSKRDSDRFDSPSRSVVSEGTPDLERSSSKKSKRDSGRFDSPVRSVVSEPAPELERSSSKKSKDKSRRKFEQFDPDSDPADVALPSITASEISHDGEFEDVRKSKKASKRHSGDHDESRSAVSESTYTYVDDEYKKSKKKSRTNFKDDFDDTRSVASAPAGDEEDKKLKKKEKRLSGGFFGLFGAKSEIGARDESPKGVKDDFEDAKRKSKKSKRNSAPDGTGLYGDVGSQSVDDFAKFSSNGNGHSNGAPNDLEDEESRSEKKTSRSRAESTSSKRDSFLARAGTLGAGVGLAGAAVAIAQHHRRSNADNAASEQLVENIPSGDSSRLQQHDILDSEITKRDFRPSIDPQYGDLLPLPPSHPASPSVEPNEHLPELPESRPDTPEAERISRDRTKSVVRRSLQETPAKSPSQSAVPLKFIMGNRSNPASPGLVRASPLQSPATPNQESLAFPRRSRPTSWDNTRDYKPLYLVESNRRLSAVQPTEEESTFPSLPPSEGTSGGSSQLDSDEFVSADEFAQEDSDTEPWQQSKHILGSLTIDTSRNDQDLLGSQQSTPKAAVFSDAEELFSSAQGRSPELQATPIVPVLTRSESPFHQLEERSNSPEHKGLALELLTGAALVSKAADLASEPKAVKENIALQDTLHTHASTPHSPSPVEPASKDRSSYLLRSSPFSGKFEEENHDSHSPPETHLRTQTGGNGFDDIEERHGSDIFGQTKKSAMTMIERRVPGEEEISRIASNANDVPAVLPASHEQSIQFAAIEDPEPIDSFTTTKSKKDKKKDKKNAKGTSRTLTWDDSSATQPSQKDMSQSEQFREIIPANLSSTTTALPIESLSHELEENTTSTAAPEESNKIQLDDTEPAEEFAVLKSKKDKKKDKKRAEAMSRTSTLDDVSSMAMRQVPITDETKSTAKEDPLTIVVGNESPLGQISTPLDEQHTTPEFFETPVNDDELIGGSPSIKSKGDKKKDKKKGKHISGTSSMDDITLEDKSLQYQLNDNLTDSIEYVKQDLPQLTGEDFVTPSESQPADEFSFASSKKSKKNKKKGAALSWDPEPIDTPTESISTSKDFTTEDVQTAVGDEPTDSFSLPKSKKDKKKSKSSISWDSEVVDDPPELSNLSRGLIDEEKAILVDESVEPLPLPKSKKDKKKDKKNKSTTAWDSEPEEVPPATSEVTSFIADDVQTPNLAEPLDDFAPIMSKKDKKKDKKKGKSVEWVSVGDEAISHPDLETRHAQYATAEPSNIDEAWQVDTKKSKKKDKKNKSKAFEIEDDTAMSSPGVVLGEPLPVLDIVEAASKQVEEPAGFDTLTSKPEQDSSALSAWEEKASVPLQESDTTTPFLEDNVAPQMKKGKKSKKGKEVVSWEPEEPIDAPELPIASEVADDFEIPGSKKKGKKGKKSHESTSLDAPLSENFPASSKNVEQMDTPIATEEDSFITTGSKKTKKKSKKMQAWDPEISAEEIQARLSDRDTGQSISGGDVDEAPLPINHSELELAHIPDPATSNPLEADDLQKSHLEAEATSSAPDGLTAGYDNDQLSLAKQLQLEFGKKSKKDNKKKRQSLPSTPDSEFPRSRLKDLAETHPRARSLSVEPLTPSDGQGTATNEAGKRVYSEDQLELARQLKAEFEGGNKKSKKDKKKRQSLVPEFIHDSPLEESQIAGSSVGDLPTPDPVVDTAKGDGFAAGYQEDQLSLARQLQAEFGSGSKKPKKDKKRRSTSQTPTQQPEVQDDYFGTSSDPVFEPLPTEQIASITDESTEGKNSPRDGLASGYKEDQLELARQLKEEFGSGNKKSKKDKKRQSLSRGLSDSYASPLDSPLDVDNDSLRNLEVEAEPEDEFAFVAKKSKKDKKGKKRESLVATAIDSESPSGSSFLDASKFDDESLPTQSEFVEEPAVPEEEFSLKRTKKDKKGKKRENSTPDVVMPLGSNMEDDSNFDDIIVPIETNRSEEAALPEEEFSLKKSKKDKKGKKRDSLLRTVIDKTESADNFGNEVEALHNSRSLESSLDFTSHQDLPSNPTYPALDASVSEDVQFNIVEDPVPGKEPAVIVAPISKSESISDPVDDWALPSKKSKKDKKKGIIQPDALSQETQAEPHSSVNEIDEERTMEDPVNKTTDPVASIEDDQNDDFTFTTKKSKKDKSNRKSTQHFFDKDTSQVPDTTIQPVDALDTEILAPSIPQPEVEDDPFEFTTKKSKKDKKNRKNIQPSLIEEEVKVPETGVEQQRESYGDQESAFAIPEVEETPAVDFEFTTKKSKKDKKNRQSATPVTTDFDEPSQDRSHQNIVDEPELQDDAFEFTTTKKSKKNDKKNRKILETAPSEIITATHDTIDHDRSLEDTQSPHSEVSPKTVDVENLLHPSSDGEKVQILESATNSLSPQQEILSQAATDIPDAPQDSFDDFTFTSKKSKKDKKDKKKQKNISPGLDEDPVVSNSKDPFTESILAVGDAFPLVEDTPTIPTTQVESSLLPIDAISKDESEQLNDEWSNLPIKKSKKDKKKLKSGLTTPLEPELIEKDPLAEVVDPPESMQATSPIETLAESVEQPEEDWGTFAPKKSKKEKQKKGKSGLSTPAEPEPTKETLLPEIVSATDIQNPEDEWAETISSKKSKKDKAKKKSGSSTPLEIDLQDKPFVADKSVTEEFASEAVEDVQQAEDEWTSAIPSKKSKKDKKKAKLGDVPALEESKDETAVNEQDSTILAEPSLPIEQEVREPETQPEDDWTGTFTSKKSKKDKKKAKSGVSTLVDTEAMAIVQENQPVIDAAPISDLPIEQEQNVELPEDDWGGFTSKKSKKDKKNRKSGVSTPITEEKPISDKSFEEVVQDPITTEPDEAPAEQIDSPQPEEEWGNFSVKKTKKDKKNRKSTTVTPIDEAPPGAESLVMTGTPLNEGDAETPSVYEDAQSDQYNTPAIPDKSLDKSEGYFAPVSKSSKKGKKNRKSGLSTPLEETYPIVTPEPTFEEKNVEQAASLTSDPIVTSPLMLPSDPPVQTLQPEIAPTLSGENAKALDPNEAVDSTFSIGRKDSKKDKRKRQLTSNALVGDEPSSDRELPLTSWADEVEEAEVERSMPVIEEIANDESLSHIASTIETAPLDDFARPTKKGKKGKKRDSVGASSLRSPTTVSIKKDNIETPSKKQAIAVTSALVGAAAVAASMTDDKALPTKKLSKKEQRKMSIDKRAPRDDVFDDPALWEGEEPMAFEESKGIDDDDAGSDGFWSPPQEEPEHNSGEQPQRDTSFSDNHDSAQDAAAKDTTILEVIEQQEKSEQYHRDSQNKIDERVVTEPEKLPPDEVTVSHREIVDPPEQSYALPDEFVTSSSKKDKKKKKKQSRLAAWDTLEQEDESKIVEPPVHLSTSELPKAIFDTMGSEKLLSEENLSHSQEPTSSSREFKGHEQSAIEYDAPSHPVSSIYGRPGSRAGSVLPVVREESPEDPSRIDRHPSPIHATADLNRDSAFITESPVPPQRGFTDKYEHIRDSGVHLRDESPAEKTRAPISATDDAIARLSWPAVDDETETVDLYKPHSQTPKIVTKGQRSVDNPRSHQESPYEPAGPSEIHPALRPKKSRDETPVKYRYDKSPSREPPRSPLSLEARLSHDNKNSSREASNASDKHIESSLDLLPSQRIGKDEKPINLHRTEAIHRTAKPESLVQQRVKRIESPDLPISHKPKEDKYASLGSSRRPNAEKPSTSKDSSLAAGAVLAGATLGFAAARKSSRELRPVSGESNRSTSNINRLRTPDSFHRPESVGSNRSTGTPPLRRSDRKSGDLRSLSQHSSPNLAKEAELAAITASTSASNVNAVIANPTANEGRVRAKDMADVYVSCH